MYNVTLDPWGNVWEKKKTQTQLNTVCIIQPRPTYITRPFVHTNSILGRMHVIHREPTNSQFTSLGGALKRLWIGNLSLVLRTDAHILDTAASHFTWIYTIPRRKSSSNLCLDLDVPTISISSQIEGTGREFSALPPINYESVSYFD